MEKYSQVSDTELVHSVCRSERLTFFNFLRMNAVPQGPQTDQQFLTLTEEAIKEMINNEYQFYFKRPYKLDIYRGERKFFKMPVLNELNRKFRVEFANTKIH